MAITTTTAQQPRPQERPPRSRPARPCPPRHLGVRLLVVVLVVLACWLSPAAEAYAPPSLPPQPQARAPPEPAPAGASASASAASAAATPRRTHALRLVTGALALAAASTTPALSPKPAMAAQAGGVRSLVNLMRVQSYVRELAGSLRSTPDGAPPEVNAQIKYVVKEMQMRASAEDAAASLGGGEAARSHGREAFEYIASIIEFSGWDEMKKPGVSKYNSLSSPDRVSFALRCLEACDRELTAFFASFPGAKVDEAREVYRAYFAPGEEM